MDQIASREHAYSESGKNRSWIKLIQLVVIAFGEAGRA
jgi:hypothetical protein